MKACEAWLYFASRELQAQSRVTANHQHLCVGMRAEQHDSQVALWSAQQQYKGRTGTPV